jgi:hypothetical protein
MAKGKFDLDSVLATPRALRELLSLERALQPRTIRAALGVHEALRQSAACDALHALPTPMLTRAAIEIRKNLQPLAALEQLTRPLALEAAAVRKLQDLAGNAASAMRSNSISTRAFADVAEILGRMNRPEDRLLRSLNAAARRLTLTGIAASIEPSVARDIGWSSFAGKQVRILSNVAVLARQDADLADLADILDEIITNAAVALDGNHGARSRIGDLQDKLREHLEASVVSPAMGLVMLFLALVAIVLTPIKPDWAEDLDARQRRLLREQQDLSEGLANLSAAHDQHEQNASRRQTELERRLADLADAVAVDRIRTVNAKTRLHSRRTGTSEVLESLDQNATVLLLRVHGRSALVEVEVSGRIGWIPKKRLEPAPR